MNNWNTNLNIGRKQKDGLVLFTGTSKGTGYETPLYYLAANKKKQEEALEHWPSLTEP